MCICDCCHFRFRIVVRVCVCYNANALVVVAATESHMQECEPYKIQCRETIATAKSALKRFLLLKVIRLYVLLLPANVKLLGFLPRRRKVQVFLSSVKKRKLHLQTKWRNNFASAL